MRLPIRSRHVDTKDAGEIGAGHAVTALYEIIPPSKLPAPPKATREENLKYQSNVKSPADSARRGSPAPAASQDRRSPETTARDEQQASRPLPQNHELLTIKLQYKQPDTDKSSLIEMPLSDAGRSFAQASTDFRFAASVASFGMILRHSPHRGNATLDAVAEIAQSSLGVEKSGYRSEFVGLVRSAKALSK